MYTHSTFMYMLGNILGRPLAPRNVDGRPDHVEEFHDDLLVVLPPPTYLCLNDLRNHTRTIYRDTIYTLLTLEGQKPISGQIGSALSNGFGLIAQTVARASAALFCREDNRSRPSPRSVEVIYPCEVTARISSVVIDPILAVPADTVVTE